MEAVPEQSSCGVGLVAARRGMGSHAVVRSALHALRCVEHRGACGPDGVSSDGAGVMTEIPFALLDHEPGSAALATLFVARDAARGQRALDVLEQSFAFLGVGVQAYREVPHDLDVLGPAARGSCPRIIHATLRRPPECRTNASFDARLYQAKQLTRTKLKTADAWMDLFFVSLSTSTVVYKALCRGADLDRFYPDLANPRFASRFALLHRRFSTNTRSTWDKAQPFRLVAHNGEINTVAGNRSWAFSREQALGLGRDELLTRQEISDSGSLNEMVEALKYRSSIPHLDDILAIMVPAADARGEFYEFWGRAMEPWDGPALLVYGDGETVGARLDRNGFRPARWCMTDDAFYLASEAGAFPVPEAAVVAKGTLHAGSGVTVGLSTGKVHFRDPSQSRNNAGASFDPRLVPITDVPRLLHPEARAAIAPVEPLLLTRQALHGLTEEELEHVLRPMIASGKEPIGSMGDTARPAIFSDQPRSLYDFFFQDFAQVTNPPLDYLREAMVTDVGTQLGPRPNIFAPQELIPPPPALRLQDPVVRLPDMEVLRALCLRRPSALRTPATELRAVYERSRGESGLRSALEELGERALVAVRDGCSLLIVSDREADFDRPPLPSLLALRAVVTMLNRHGLRLQTSILVEAGDIRSTHALACAIGFGATAVCPRLALEQARFGEHPDLHALPPAVREDRLCQALLQGLLKVMAKMGISVVRSYQSSKLFTPLGLGPKLLRQYFGLLPAPLGGLELPQLAARLEHALRWAERHPPAVPLPSTHQLKEKKRGWAQGDAEGGERHAMTAERSKLVHDLVRGRRGRDPAALWQEYEQLGDVVAPVAPRHLLDLRMADAPQPLAAVEDEAAILARFGSGAMSFGAISAEAQRDLFIAMRSVGARCNSGEGGENPYYFVDGTTASTKQIASGRFGVTAEYLVTGEEIEIKIAQGAKPGEGGQLMGVKVDEAIARARFARPGIDLVSPPPMHDIYSIEDLKQLVYELGQLSPGVPVCVKLVAGTNVGTIAAGVVKAGAHVIQISGGDGGTGAAPLSSMKHAGLPWELGLIDVHRRLVELGLRDHVRLRVDGGLATPRDIVMAALLGAEEFGFGKLLLVAQGCIMARVCEKNRCPTGIATHDPRFKAKYKGSPEHIVALVRRLAAGVRELLAGLGARSLDEIVGQRRFLRAAERHEALVIERGIDLGGMLEPVAWSRRAAAAELPHQGWSAHERSLVEQALAQLDASGRAEVDAPVHNTDRAVATGLAGELARRAHLRRMAALREGGPAEPLFPAAGAVRLRLEGSAGQGLAAFAVSGMHLDLRGEANDGVAKSMSGGRVVVRPPAAARYLAEDNVIIGNGALYGATGGTLFVHGRAGDRFAVRNSGATAVVEGAGLHACEYMTGGTVVVLGPVSANAGAGMTGGRLFIPAASRGQLAADYVVAAPPTDDEREELLALLRDYLAATGSRTARALLAQPGTLAQQLLRVWPRAEVPVGAEEQRAV